MLIVTFWGWFFGISVDGFVRGIILDLGANLVPVLPDALEVAALCGAGVPELADGPLAPGEEVQLSFSFPRTTSKSSFFVRVLT